MTDPITQAREIVSGMTPGRFAQHSHHVVVWGPDGGNVASCGDPKGATVAGKYVDPEFGAGLDAAYDNAAGIVLATNLLRTLTSEGAEDALKAHIEKELGIGPRIWAGTLARAVISHLLAQAIGEGK